MNTFCDVNPCCTNEIKFTSYQVFPYVGNPSFLPIDLSFHFLPQGGPLLTFSVPLSSASASWIPRAENIAGIEIAAENSHSLFPFVFSCVTGWHQGWMLLQIMRSWDTSEAWYPPSKLGAFQCCLVSFCFFTFWNSGVFALSRTWRCGPFLYGMLLLLFLRWE